MRRASVSPFDGKVPLYRQMQVRRSRQERHQAEHKSDAETSQVEGLPIHPTSFRAFRSAKKSTPSKIRTELRVCVFVSRGAQHSLESIQQSRSAQNFPQQQHGPPRILSFRNSQ